MVLAYLALVFFKTPTALPLHRHFILIFIFLLKRANDRALFMLYVFLKFLQKLRKRLVLEESVSADPVERVESSVEQFELF